MTEATTDRADVFVILGQKINALEQALAASVERERRAREQVRWLDDMILGIMALTNSGMRGAATNLAAAVYANIMTRR